MKTRFLSPDAKKNLAWIDKELGQIGINVRQSCQHVEIIYYLELLKEEIQMTKTFLVEDEK